MKNKIMKSVLLVLCAVLLYSTYTYKSSCGLGQETWITEMMVDLTNKGYSGEEAARAVQEEARRRNGITSSAPTTQQAPKPKADHKHSYKEEVTQEPTCTEKGIKTFTCECGATYKEEIPVVEHKYEETITKEATCTTDGEKTFTCTVCGDSYTEPIEAYGHDFGDFVIDKEPTCEHGGSQSRHCSRCEETTDIIILERLEHVGSGEYVVVRKPSMFRAGIKEEYCINCGAVVHQEEIPVVMTGWYIIGGILLAGAVITGCVIVKRTKK